MITAQYPTNKYFFQLGKLLVREKPDIANQLISEYFPPTTPPIESNLDRVPDFFNLFCKTQELDPEDYTGALYKSSKIDKRRFFIAVIIVIYHPHKRKLAKCISETIQQDPGATTRMIQEVEFRYKKIDEFKVEVDAMVKKLTTK